MIVDGAVGMVEMAQTTAKNNLVNLDDERKAEWSVTCWLCFAVIRTPIVNSGSIY